MRVIPTTTWTYRDHIATTWTQPSRQFSEGIWRTTTPIWVEDNFPWTLTFAIDWTPRTEVTTNWT